MLSDVWREFFGGMLLGILAMWLLGFPLWRRRDTTPPAPPLPVERWEATLGFVSGCDNKAALILDDKRIVTAKFTSTFASIEMMHDRRKRVFGYKRGDEYIIEGRC